MIKNFSAVLTVLLFHGFLKAEPIDDLINVFPSKIKTVAQFGKKVLPTNYRQGINEYLQVIGMDAARGMNTSIAKFNDEILRKNPCFSDLATEFYLAIQKEDIERSAKSGIPYFTNALSMPLSAKPKDFGKEPGWLWEKALEFSRGDKLLAIQLIGICGHDDKLQLIDDISGIPFSSEKAERLRKMSPSEADLKKVALSETKYFRDEEESIEERAQYYFRMIKEPFEFKNRKGIGCPQATSAFFAPQALGIEFDISDQLKEKVSKTQAPTKGAQSLPGKNYHIMGSAYASCLLLRRGIPQIVAEKIVMGAINSYRSSRICEFIKSDFQVPSHLSVSQITKEFISLRSQADENVCLVEKPPYVCELNEMFDLNELRDSDMTQEIIEKKVTRYFARSDAARLFRASPFFDRANGCEGPQLGSAIRDFASVNSISSKVEDQTRCPSGLSRERCDSARRLIETYFVDFEWSEGQHKSGFEFARKNCPTYNPANPPENVACKIQNRIQDAEKAKSEIGVR